MIEQIWIGLFSVTAIFLSQDKRPALRRWACVFGLVGQPAWFYTSFVHEQWGVFALCFIYTYLWWRGFRNFWILKRPA